MDFQDITLQARQIRKRYAELESKKYGRPWTKEQIAQGLVGDVGDLMKLVTAKQGVREISDADVKIAHELSDCLWSVIILADEYGVDIERAFLATMDKLNKKLAASS